MLSFIRINSRAFSRDRKCSRPGYEIDVVIISQYLIDYVGIWRFGRSRDHLQEDVEIAA